MAKYKVLFFDSWKGGSHNFIRLLEAFKANDIDSLLVHLGSWGNEDLYEPEEIINSLLVRDISYYKTKNLKKILDIEQPDLVLFLSTHTFAHRAVIRYCNLLGIPTINLYHGFVRVQDVESKSGAYKVNKIAYTLFVLKRLPKLLTHTLPAYMMSLWRTNASYSDWYSFLKNLIEVFTKAGSIRSASDAKTTMCLVYAPADKQHAINAYGFNESEVKDVGNPDLVVFNLTSELISYGINKDLSSNKFVLYIDTALTATGLIVKNKTEYLEHLVYTKNELEKAGKVLLFKPHPETVRLYDTDAFSKHGINVIDNNDLTLNIMSSCAVITEPSTLALIPALMGMPLFLAQYSALSELRFGEVLTSYPKSLHLKNIADFEISVVKINNANSSKYIEEWIQYNSGPLPASEMPFRVSKCVIELINSKSTIKS